MPFTAFSDNNWQYNTYRPVRAIGRLYILIIYNSAYTFNQVIVITQ